MECELCLDNLCNSTCKECGRYVCDACMDTTACVECLNGYEEE